MQREGMSIELLTSLAGKLSVPDPLRRMTVPGYSAGAGMLMKVVSMVVRLVWLIV